MIIHGNSWIFVVKNLKYLTVEDLQKTILIKFSFNYRQFSFIKNYRKRDKKLSKNKSKRDFSIISCSLLNIWCV